MSQFALAAAAGGAGGIRANGPDDIRAIRSVVTLPIIGIYKRLQADGQVLITPSFEHACEIVRAGADIVALDCTLRGQRFGALQRLRRIRAELGVPVMADIATIDEAVAAAEAGADLIGSTMRGYTEETASVHIFEPEFIAALATRFTTPIVAEGRVESPLQAVEAIRAGATAVVVGTAITRPRAIASKFALALERERARCESGGYVLGIDLGGTNTKAGIVSMRGCLNSEVVVPTPSGGREILMAHLKEVARRGLEMAAESGIRLLAVSVATAGWVDPQAGRVVHATDNLPGWTGTPIAKEMAEATGLPVAVENDAYALAVAERHFGAAQGVDNFACLTLGTGIGGSCYTGGRLVRGAHSLASSFGHLPIQPNGLACNCGLRGCLEVYANAAALLRYGGQAYRTPGDVIRAAHSGEPSACQALRIYAGYLSTGIVSIIHLADPSLIVLSGGLTQDNQLLFTYLEQELGKELTPERRHTVKVQASSLGYYGGVLGAAAVAIERFE